MIIWTHLDPFGPIYTIWIHLDPFGPIFGSAIIRVKWYRKWYMPCTIWTHFSKKWVPFGPIWTHLNHLDTFKPFGPIFSICHLWRDLFCRSGPRRVRSSIRGDAGDAAARAMGRRPPRRAAVNSVRSERDRRCIRLARPGLDLC